MRTLTDDVAYDNGMEQGHEIKVVEFPVHRLQVLGRSWHDGSEHVIQDEEEKNPTHHLLEQVPVREVS